MLKKKIFNSIIKLTSIFKAHILFVKIFVSYYYYYYYYYYYFNRKFSEFIDKNIKSIQALASQSIKPKTVNLII
jgi:hypothetical protein